MWLQTEPFFFWAWTTATTHVIIFFTHFPPNFQPQWILFCPPLVFIFCTTELNCSNAITWVVCAHGRNGMNSKKGQSFSSYLLRFSCTAVTRHSVRLNCWKEGFVKISSCLELFLVLFLFLFFSISWALISYRSRKALDKRLLDC